MTDRCMKKCYLKKRSIVKVKCVTNLLILISNGLTSTNLSGIKQLCYGNVPSIRPEKNESKTEKVPDCSKSKVWKTQRTTSSWFCIFYTEDIYTIAQVAIDRSKKTIKTTIIWLSVMYCYRRYQLWQNSHVYKGSNCIFSKIIKHHHNIICELSFTMMV